MITVKSLKEFLSQAESKYRRLMKDRAQAEGEVKVLRAALTSYKAAMVISITISFYNWFIQRVKFGTIQ